MDNNTIGQKIFNLRHKHGLSQKDFAAKIGVTNKAVSKWENDISKPSLDMFLKMCHMFSVSFDDFYPPVITDDKGRLQGGKMQSLTQLYRIGRGPSSSHTMGPERACQIFMEKNPSADSFKVILYGSLARTGVGHGTDVVIKKTFSPFKTDVEFNFSETLLPHPNTFDMFAIKNEKIIDECRAYSPGGGYVSIEGISLPENEAIYKLSTFSDIKAHCKENRQRLWEYAAKIEGDDIWSFLNKIWIQMKTSIEEGLVAEGVLPGGLMVQRKAKYLLKQAHIDESPETKENRMVCAYAFAVSEQNAAGETIVTAPTCGASGVLPAVMYYYQQKRGFSDREILKALATASVVGNLVKTNASISGAECGCQAEIGTACSMTAAALGELLSMSIEQIEYAAEIAFEHHLGLTCDPIGGLVQIPCIERNAVAAMRAINAVSLANFLTDTRKISLDLIINTMYETGKDISGKYRETSIGGLAKLY